MKAEMMMQDGIPWEYDEGANEYLMYVLVRMPASEVSALEGNPKAMVAEVMLRIGQALYSATGTSE
jgi:hypothetical protein